MAKLTKILAPAGSAISFKVCGGPDDGKVVDLGKVVGPVIATLDVPDGQPLNLPLSLDVTLTDGELHTESRENSGEDEQHFSE